MMLESRNRNAAREAALADFADRLERFFRDNYTALVRQHARLGTVEDVQEAIQDVLMRLYQRWADGEQEPDNLAAFVNVAIRNALIDRRRQSRLVPLSDVASATARSDAEARDDDSAIQQVEDRDSIGQEEELAWKQLLHAIFDRLPPKSVEVAAMVMSGKTPPEIGAAFRQDGYVLRRYARELICKILWELASGGEPLAGSFAQSFCAAPRRRGKI
ncbi:sigma-70 family RNA polymerase sigma factor [Bradyrhizobium sp. AUGA SZCCT0051]|nr:sigma-70 family RNA polymerase sigma factor [Bradyrhizobium sp. AUGA SZCCT0124]MBR1317059.1 sigma-70 family RNA polymerase sigma factor [Bradyrhizobium sp. AUGA SZCCT0051]MBR1345207.1 sigma-70 family RNA polymerase sigma factor [Bradyrhizobium sp. AUGA SZCCT0105]MBR1360302.1 sigma-70 family RNA polymerase sigma factor [Bradyrhizobium sp. AUGA SZCCT0045]